MQTADKINEKNTRGIAYEFKWRRKLNDQCQLSEQETA